MQNFIVNQWLPDEDSSINIKSDWFVKGLFLYEVVRTYNRLPFALKKHYDRLLRCAEYMGVEKALPGFDRLASLVMEGIEMNRTNSELRIRIVLAGQNLLLLYEELPVISKDIYELGVKVGISPFQRPSENIIPGKLKLIGAPWSFLSKTRLGECYDLLLLNEKGELCEGSFTNVFLVKEETLITPYEASGILPGITRENVLNLASALEMKVEIRKVMAWEAFVADEIFLTHTSAGIVPVRRLESKVLIEEFPDGYTRILMDNFEGYVMTREDNWKGIKL
ncbi:aminotransferase class IV [Kosmotoga arenicorallina S304]|uniref:Aminotransferase class IV n=1 Tax=Kosmotoga arenicorallina S304 TaxID=1453497 RepID=A0A182C7Z7_9BACT|nr:aminotransferase class IV [Kosmotoga arenicorallina]OAA31853.1 aminotransferase class IV [Kosmotoga arenicorallina S304]